MPAPTVLPTLLLMAGLPGAGKTALALALGRRLGWPVLDKDSVKSALLDLGAEEALAGPASYRVLIALADDIVAGQGMSVIVDSPAAYESVTDAARAVASRAGARLAVVLCTAATEVRARRIRGRSPRLSQPTAATPSALSLIDGVGRARFAHLPVDTLVLDTNVPLAELVERALGHIQPGGSC